MTIALYSTKLQIKIDSTKFKVNYLQKNLRLTPKLPSSMLEEPLFFLLSTDFPDLTETETRARTPPMRSKNP